MIEATGSLSGLAQTLKGRFESWKESRRTQEDEWIASLRQYNGLYSPEVEAELRRQNTRSRVFIGLTRTKVMAAYSKIIDLLFQPGDSPWNIEPTPIPKIPGMREKLLKKAQMDVMSVMGGVPAGMEGDAESVVHEREEEISKEIEEEAQERAARMMKHIADQLQEAKAEQKLKDSIMEMCICGTGAMKVGTVRMERVSHWRHTNNSHALVIDEYPMPEMDTVSIFDLYPDPYATSMRDADGIFRRHVMTRHQLASLKDVNGFKADEVDYLLSNYRSGNHEELEHERERRLLRDVTNIFSSKRYEVLEYWGMVDGQELVDSGVDIPDDMITVQVEANVWMSSGRILKAQINPLPTKRIPYLLVPYERHPHQFWGVGVPKMMRDSQATMNACVRIAIDNMSISSGPLVEVNEDLLAPGEDPSNIYPWRVFIRSGGDPSAPAVRFNQPVANANSLLGMMETFRRFADETTSLPSYTHGMQSNSMNATATGMSMLLGQANIAIKSVIKNLDDYLIEPMVELLYEWNMEWSDDESIKGDMRIRARGSTALIQKEVQSQRLLQFLSLVNNPMDMQGDGKYRVDRGQLLRQIAKSMDVDSEKVIVEVEPGGGQVIGGAGQPPPVDGLVPPVPPEAGASPQGLGNNGGLPL